MRCLPADEVPHRASRERMAAVAVTGRKAEREAFGRPVAEPAMQLIPDDLRSQLLANGARSAAGEQVDPYPVVKLFTPDAGATWLLTELDPGDPDLAFGLCDLGLGCPELGYVRLSERDLFFQADKPLSRYASDAHAAGMIRA
jgi:hypothetical protein